MAAAETREKVAASPLLAFKHTKTKKLSEAARENKRKRDQQRDKSRVTLHKLYPRWRELRDRLGFTMDTELAEMLMDSYEKQTEASSPLRAEPPTSSPPSGFHSDQCPYCGFVLPQWCLQNRNTPKEVTERVRVKLEVQPKEEPLSDAEEADVKSFVLEGESEGNSDEDSKPPLDLTATNSETKTTTTTATEESEDGGGDEWIPPWTNNWTLKTAAAEESDKEEEEEEEDEEDEDEESEESGADEKNSDDDWTPPQLNTRTRTKSNSDDEQTAKASSGEESAETGESSTLAQLQEVSSILEHRPGKRKLCTECGMFYRKLPHECEHKVKPFVCNICGKRCVSESYLKLHYGIHMETYEHACKFCYANFKTRVDKLAHELIHQEQEDPYRCPDCALTFPSFKGRAQHAKQHRDENPFKCPICGTQFGDRPAFLRHMVVHTGERAFKCPVCGRGFNQGSHLKSHMRLHTGERPYACQLCDKSFTHNVSLKSHVQRCHAPKREDTSSETQDTGADGETERKGERGGKAAKSKCRRPLTGRPKGRPKRVAAQNRKQSKTVQDSDDGSSEYDYSMFYM